MNSNMKRNSIDLSKFKKIEDIIFLDEPILSHLVKNNKHFLLYLIDSLDNSDLYLLLEVEEETIYYYLTGKLSLRNLILENENICYTVEQDFNGSLIEVNVIQNEYLDNNYLPAVDSFLNYNPTFESYYYSFIKEYESKSYLNTLREKAFYLKISTKNKKFANTIGFNELANNLLSNISTSFKSFLKADFFVVFKNITSDQNRLNKIFNNILPDIDYRMVDLKFGSFEIGLAVDDVMKGNIENKEMKEWAIKVGNKYKDIVLDDTYDENNVKRIVDTYTVDDRKKIFNPIFKITENSDFNLEIKKNKLSKYSTLQIKDKSIIERIVPNVIEDISKPDAKEYQIVNLTTVVDKNKKVKSINIENTLFNSTDETEAILNNKDFEKYGFIINTEISIKVHIKTEKNLIILVSNFDDLVFEVKDSSGKFEDGIRKLIHNIYEYILNKK